MPRRTRSATGSRRSASSSRTPHRGPGGRSPRTHQPKETEVPGSSQRKGAIRKKPRGNPTAGSGGRVRRGLEGKGPTPKAVDRTKHPAHKRAKAKERAEKRTTGRRPDRKDS